MKYVNSEQLSPPGYYQYGNGPRIMVQSLAGDYYVIGPIYNPPYNPPRNFKFDTSTETFQEIGTVFVGGPPLYYSAPFNPDQDSSFFGWFYLTSGNPWYLHHTPMNGDVYTFATGSNPINAPNNQAVVDSSFFYGLTSPYVYAMNLNSPTGTTRLSGYYSNIYQFQTTAFAVDGNKLYRLDGFNPPVEVLDYSSLGPVASFLGFIQSTSDVYFKSGSDFVFINIPSGNQDRIPGMIYLADWMGYPVIGPSGPGVSGTVYGPNASNLGTYIKTWEPYEDGYADYIEYNGSISVPNVWYGPPSAFSYAMGKWILSRRIGWRIDRIGMG